MKKNSVLDAFNVLILKKINNFNILKLEYILD